MESKAKWDDRKALGSKMMELIDQLVESAKKEESQFNKQKLCHTISYMAQTLNSLITSENEITKRLEKLEEIAGITRRHGNNSK